MNKKEELLMENLKFRAKANINDEWVYASNIHKVILDDTNEKLWVMHPKGEKIEHLGDGYIKYRPLVVDEETIGQYTGLKDKNGTEIYVGDTVRYDRNIGLTIDGYRFVVAYEEGQVFLDHKFSECKNIDWDLVTIVGNIHENKELLD